MKRAGEPAKRGSPRKAQPASKKDKPRAFPIVGIGASAGGLEAMTLLLRALPDKPGMAFVLVQHLDPTHESAMATLLSRSTTMPVLEASHNVAIEPNHVYVIPPNKLMVVSKRRLKLLPRTESKASYSPIDHFLKSLAKEEGNRAVGIILSGSGGSDGTLGCLAIKSNGGITFAQDEKTAKYPAMPAAAVAARCVDFVLPPDKIARELAQLAGHPYIAPAGTTEEAAAEQPAEEKAFDEILATVRRHMTVDFTHYKRATLHRRVERRMVLHKFEELSDYALYLRSHPDEVRELFNDILIHVTSFFRDPTVFQLLKRKVLPRLFKGRASNETIRIWVPGCSTGEEVYSLAMLITEYMSEKNTQRPVHIFGTDINEAALEKARSGIYPQSIQEDIGAERLRRFFLKTESGFRISKSIRELCIFARQNVVTDPPFSNLDLVSCRNVLIYLGVTLQRKVLPLFHYALKPSGYLLLGGSETIGTFAELFAIADQKCKLYVKKEARTRPVVTFGHPAIETQVDMPAEVSNRVDLVPSLVEIQKQADRIVLTEHSPAGVVINRQMEVLQFRGRTGPFLEHAHGRATLNLLKMAREGLMIGLRAVVNRAIRQNLRAHEENVPVKQNDGLQLVNIDVVPFQVPPERDWFYLVLFEAVPTKESKGDASKEPGLETADNAEITRLREELAMTRESLQAIIEEQEATNEELRSANEEIMSSNEELQSTNEELETAKEELQSSNEELATLNDELEDRNAELEHVNNDVYNLLASVNIPILMVGVDLRIRRFTAVTERLLNLIPGDVGRPLSDINLGLMVPQLGQFVAEVIDTLQVREIEVQDKDRHWWSLRIRPYKTIDNKIDGAVLALVDIDFLKANAGRDNRRRAFAEAIVDTLPQPMVVLDEKFAVQSINTAFRSAFHLEPEDVLERPLFDSCHGAWDIPKLQVILQEALAREASFDDLELEQDFPGVGRIQMRLQGRPLSCEDGARHLLLTIKEFSESARP